MKLSKGKIILISLLVAVSVAAIIISTVLIAKYCKKNEDSLSEGEGLSQTAEDVDTFIDVDKNFCLGMNSQSAIQKTDLEIVDQNGVPADFSVIHTDDNLYSLQAPVNGWEEGNTYKVTLFEEGIKFQDEGAYDKRSVTFTVDREDVLNVTQKDSVVEIEGSVPFETNIDCSVVYIDPNIIAEKGIKKDSIIIVPTEDEFGFVVQTAYKVTGVSGNSVSVIKPDYDEVFEELDVKGNFEPVLNEQNVHFYGDEDIEEQILASEPVKALAAQSESSNLPKIKISLSMQGQAIKFKYSVTFPKFFDDYDFVMEGTSTVTIGAKADISIWKGTFDLGANLSYKNEVKYSLVMKSSLGENGQGIQLFKNASKKLQDMLNKNSKAKNLATKIFEMYIPTPIPALGFSFEVKVNFKLEAKIELGITFTDEYSLSVGVKRDRDGVNPYFNKTVKKDTTSVEYCGSIEAKLGLSVKFSGSVCGVLKAGVEFEIGAYAKLAGFVKVQSIHELTDTEESYSGFAGSGVYFEVGIYSNLNVFAELDLKLIKFDVKVGILEVKIPVFSIGNTQLFEIIPNVDAVVFDEDGSAYLPNVTVKTCDMFTGKTETKTVDASDLNQNFNFEYDSTKVNVNDKGKLSIVDKSAIEFNVDFHLKLKAWQNFLPKFEVSAGTGGIAISIKGSRGLIHYEVGAINAVCTINIAKQPVVVKQLMLGYNCVTDDNEYGHLHPELTNEELVYNVREQINGINDYQIGRLVKVVPEFVPYNASYKQLEYSIDKGEQYIVGGADGIITYNEGGITYALFRVVDDENAIGNINGIVDITKEIKLTATTIGYKGEYASWNKTDETEYGIYASAVPTINFEITPVIEDQYVAQTAVQAGNSVQFTVDHASVFPQNATRGVLANETLYVKSGSAKILNGDEVVVDTAAEIGSQIVVASMLSGVEREYFLNIVKTDIESIELSATVETAKPGDVIELNCNIIGKGGDIPTVNEVVYVVASGGKYVYIQESETLNAGLLNVLDSAKVGSAIRLFAIADGKRSNTIEIYIDKIAVETVSLISEVEGPVHKGETIQLESSILPLNASFKEVRYSIISGEQYAILDSYNGKLIISNSCVGGEIIELQCVADGIPSEILRLTVNTTDVQYVKFPNNYATVRGGQAVQLDAFVNPDATNKDLIYSITEGSEFAEIDGNLLIVKDELDTYGDITVRAISVSDNTLYAEKYFTIYEDNASLSINGEYDNVIMFTGESAIAVVTDSAGQIVNNQNVQFTITRAGQSTDLASVDNEGRVTIASKISASISTLQVVLKSNYNGTVNELYIDIIIGPVTVELVLEGDEDIKAAELKPGEQVALKLLAVKQDNASEFDNLELEVSDNLNAYIESVDEGYGLISYRIIVQVSATALTGDLGTVKVNYIVAGKNIATSSAFNISVGRITDDVRILNIPETINVADSITLIAAGYPENANYKPTFEFADLSSENYAKLNNITGELIVNNNIDLSGKQITLRAKLDGIFSQIYTINIVNEIQSITIGIGKDSTDVQYIPEYEFYFLYPNGKFVVSSEVVGGTYNSEIHYALDKVGERYLSISGNEITVKEFALNHGINASLVAYADNGVISNTIVIYIPIAVSSVSDWFNIQDNIVGYYVLTNDIDFSGVTFSPLTKFGGILDGCGHSILNVSITETNEKYCFGLIEENYGMIFNLIVGRFSVKLTESVNTVCGGAICSKNYGYINNCKVVSTDHLFISIFITTAETYVGGICGYNYGTIKNSTSQIYINSYGCAAGVAGLNAEGGYIVNCINRGYISAFNYDDNTMAGIVGLNLGEIESSTNYGKIIYK